MFVCTATKMEYIKSRHSNLTEWLKIVLGLTDQGYMKPFQQLHLLYATISADVEPEYKPTLFCVPHFMLHDGLSDYNHNR